MMTSLCVALVALTAAAAPDQRSLQQFVPADAMAAWFGRPSPEMLTSPPGSTVDQLSGWIIALKAMGVIPAQGRIVADIVGSLPLLGRRPHVAMLLDVTSRRVERDIYRLNTLQAGLVIEARGSEKDIERRVRDLLMTYTSAQTGKIEQEMIGGVECWRLSDNRLPEWAVARWANVGGLFVVGFGDEAFARIVEVIAGRADSLQKSAWFRQAHARCHGETSGIEIFVDLARIHARVGEVVEGRPEQVMRAIGLQNVAQVLWSIGFEGRALRSEVAARETDGREHYRILTGPDVASPQVAALIPPEASSYAAFRLPLSKTFGDARNAYMESQSESKRNRLLLGWSYIEREYGFDINDGIIDRLGEHLIFHTWPPHPLGLPLLVTVWIEIKGDPALVRQTIDGAMAAWRDSVNRAIPDTRPAFTLSPRVGRDPDGIWYLQLGLAGPAVAVTDGWIVISYSPEAVRENLRYLQAAATHPALPGTVTTRPPAATSE